MLMLTACLAAQAPHDPSGDRLLVHERGVTTSLDAMQEANFLLDSSSLPSLDDVMQPLSAERTRPVQRASQAGSEPKQHR